MDLSKKSSYLHVSPGLSDFTETYTQVRSFGPIQPDSPVGNVSEILTTPPIVPTMKVARLICTCHQFQKNHDPWCLHIETCIHKGLDGRNVYGDKVELPAAVEVPVCRDPWVALPVALISSPIPNCRAVVATCGTDKFHETLGHIFIGQGRRDLRTLIEEWLVEQAIKGLPTCRATQHWRKLPWEDSKFYPTSRHHLANLADLLFTGKCRSCNEDEGVPDV